MAKKPAPAKRQAKKAKTTRGKVGSKPDSLEELTEKDLERVVGGTSPGNSTYLKPLKPRTVGRLP